MAALKKEFLFTPAGIAEPYCALQKPDYGNEEKGFGNPRGEYKVNLTIPSKEAQPLIDKIVKAHEQNYAKLLAEHEKNPPVVPRGKKPLLPYEGDMPFIENDDGTVTFKFKGYASYQDKTTKETKHIALKVVDAKGKRIDVVPAIAGGSKLKVRFSMFPYGWNPSVGASVKLQLDSVMLIELVEYQAGSRDWAGQEEEGYVAPDDRDNDWREEEPEEGSEGADDHGDF